MHDQKGAGQMEFIYNWILKLSFFCSAWKHDFTDAAGSWVSKICPFRSGTDSDSNVGCSGIGIIGIREPHLKKFIITVYIRFRSVNWKKKVRKFRKRFSG